MKPSTKVKKDLEKIKALLLKSGIEEEKIEQAIDSDPMEREAISRQGEAVLLFLEKPAAFTSKECKRTECGEWFGTNYRSVAYCSDFCRAKEISKQTGLKWNYNKNSFDRWGGEPPLIIPPEAFKHLKIYVKVLQLQNQIETLPSQSQVQLNYEYEKIPEQDIVPAIPLVEPSLVVQSYTQEEKENPFDF